MPRRVKHTLTFAPEVVDHLDAIDRKYHRLIEKSIDQQLAFGPDQETRNRKPLQAPAPFGATWEIRFGPNNRFRVLYDVDGDAKEVFVLAIGVKMGNKLMIGSEEIEL